MGLVLSVREGAWRAHVEATAAALPGLIPVVKGNGYGFGRRLLAAKAAPLADRYVAVGTVHEVGDVPAGIATMVLTPEMGPLPEATRQDVTLTVGSTRHVEHLARAGWHGPVVVKLASSMRRYGCEPDELAHLLSAIAVAGLEPVAHALHLPLAGTPEEHLAEVEAWLPRLDPALVLAVSHLDTGCYAELRARHPERAFAVRAGTALWHGDKSALQLGATVNDVRPARAGQRAGYRGVQVPADGHLVMVGAGSAHGITPLADGRSPFHFARRRLALVEPPHMHTTMVLVPRGDPCPEPGDLVDVQRPLTQTAVDRIEWLP